MLKSKIEAKNEIIDLLKEEIMHLRKQNQACQAQNASKTVSLDNSAEVNDRLIENSSLTSNRSERT